MIQAPGLVNAKDIPHWINDIQLMLKAGYTEDELRDMSLVTKRRLITFIRGEARGLAQLRRKKR